MSPHNGRYTIWFLILSTKLTLIGILYEFHKKQKEAMEGVPYETFVHQIDWYLAVDPYTGSKEHVPITNIHDFYCWLYLRKIGFGERSWICLILNNVNNPPRLENATAYGNTLLQVGSSYANWRKKVQCKLPDQAK